MKDARQAVVTFKPESAQAAREELRETSPELVFLETLSPGVELWELPEGFAHLASRLAKLPPVFLQHIFPVHFTLETGNRPQDLEAVAELAPKLVKLLTPGKSFSVQSRVLAENSPFQPFHFNQALSLPLIEAGFELDVKHPRQVVSLLAGEKQCRLGVSHPEENLSDWAGGRHRLARESGQISRAEFKLLEALKVFGLSLPAEGLALDLGAAPGGWSRILLKNHLEVWAIDPAEMDARLSRHPQLKHCRETVQLFLRRNLGIKFDLLVNDLKLDALDSAGVVNRFHSWLNPEALVIMTLKLPESEQLKRVRAAREMLAQRYQVLGVKQLFHNRLEATVALRRK